MTEPCEDSDAFATYQITSCTSFYGCATAFPQGGYILVRHAAPIKQDLGLRRLCQLSRKLPKKAALSIFVSCVPRAIDPTKLRSTLSSLSPVAKEPYSGTVNETHCRLSSYFRPCQTTTQLPHSLRLPLILEPGCSIEILSPHRSKEIHSTGEETTKCDSLRSYGSLFLTFVCCSPSDGFHRSH